MGSSALSNQWSRLMGPGQGACVVAWHVRAADSEWVSRVWVGAQAESGLPPPALAVDGSAGWLVCFAPPSGTPTAQARAVLRGLIQGWLRQAGVNVSASDVAAWRFTCWPDELPAEAAIGEPADNLPVPRQTGPDRWSAFVAPDLVPVFAETPWLDCEPSQEGQAALLGKLQPISAADWARLSPPTASQVGPAVADESGLGRQAGDALAADPRTFLLTVMNDDSVDMALRIEAARVLLAHG